jgi:hypothetical protein
MEAAGGTVVASRVGTDSPPLKQADVLAWYAEA